MQRVIVTGGTGFIGRHLVRKLSDYKSSSIVLISDKSIDFENILGAKSFETVQLRAYTADIRDGETISDIFQNEKPDACIHLAAKISVADSMKNSDETMNTNVNGTLNVLEACNRNKVNNFIFASSAAVYGDASKLPISEDAILSPLSPYGTSKMLAEELVFRYHKLKMVQNSAVFRIFNVYGPGNVNESDVISRFAARLSKGLPPIIHGDGKYTRDFISVDDVVDGILLCIRAMESKNNGNFNYPPVFNMGGGSATSINELAQKMIAISELELEPIFEKINRDSGIIMHSCADMTKAKRNLHFVARKELETGLKEILGQIHGSKQNM
jgi:UDP-glucose 4-epimerase